MQNVTTSPQNNVMVAISALIADVDDDFISWLNHNNHSFQRHFSRQTNKWEKKETYRNTTWKPVFTLDTCTEQSDMGKSEIRMQKIKNCGIMFRWLFNRCVVWDGMMFAHMFFWLKEQQVLKNQHHSKGRWVFFLMLHLFYIIFVFSDCKELYLV